DPVRAGREQGDRILARRQAGLGGVGPAQRHPVPPPQRQHAGAQRTGHENYRVGSRRQGRLRNGQVTGASLARQPAVELLPPLPPLRGAKMDPPRDFAMTRRFLLPLVLLAAAALPDPARAADPDPVLADEMALKVVGLPTDGPGLVDFFRLRGQADVPPEKVAALVKQLDTADLAVREKACGELIAIGPPALPELRRAARDGDSADAAALAQRCLKALDADSARLTAAAARLLTVRRPAGAAETLLAFLPYVENDSVLDDVKTTPATVAYREGKPDDALFKALGDDTPLRRAVAIEVLCSNGRAEPRATLRKLLQDPVPVVRFQAGIALVQCNDAEAVTTMIA